MIRHKRTPLAAVGILAAALIVQAMPATATPTVRHLTVRDAGTSAAPSPVAIPTTQFLPNPWTPPGTGIIHTAQLRNLKGLGADYDRLQLYSYFPNQAMAQLQPPTATNSGYNFHCMDQIVKEFYSHSAGTRTINLEWPNWMFTYAPGTTPPSSFSNDCGELAFNYTPAATGLVDPTGQQAARYMVDVFRWYTQGGFRDQNGVFHYSGYHYPLDTIELGNEVSQFEYDMTPALYTTLYDATYKAIHAVDPYVKFGASDIVPLSVEGDPGHITSIEFDPNMLFTWERYLLNPANHADGVKVDYFNWHNYYNGLDTSGPSSQWNSVFDSSHAGADEMLRLQSTSNAIRNEYSPTTKFNMNEFGVFLSLDTNSPYSAYPDRFWALSSAYYAYAFMGLSQLGVHALRMTQMLAYPGNAPSVTMMNWETGAPNEKWWALKMINSEIGANAHLVGQETNQYEFAAQKFLTYNGKTRLLLVNKTNDPISITLPGHYTKVLVVDETTGANKWKTVAVTGTAVTLQPYATAVAE